MASSGWFVGMMLAVVFLIIVCVIGKEDEKYQLFVYFFSRQNDWVTIFVFIVCFIKRNRGGKYAVQESEERQGRREPYDDAGFSEYTKP